MQRLDRGPQIDVADVVAGGLILAGLYKIYRTASRMCMAREQAAAQRGFEEGRHSDIRLQLDDWMVKLNEDEQRKTTQSNLNFQANLELLLQKTREEAYEEGRQQGREDIIKELN